MNTNENLFDELLVNVDALIKSLDDTGTSIQNLCGIFPHDPEFRRWSSISKALRAVKKNTEKDIKMLSNRRGRIN